MTENEKDLLTIIRENDHPKEAIMIALETIFYYLMQCESSVEPIVVGSREQV